MLNPKFLVLVLAVFLFSSSAFAQTAKKRCSKPKRARQISSSVAPYATLPLTGGSHRRLAAACRLKCQADAPCMAYEYTATGMNKGDCELYTSGKLARGSRRKDAAGICKVIVPDGSNNDNDNDNNNYNTDPSGCPPGFVWSADLGRCVPKDVMVPDDGETDSNNPDNVI